MKILKEEVLGVRGDFVIKARIITYTQHDQGRRCELVFEQTSNQNFQVGWTQEELADLYNRFIAWKKSVGEV